MEIEKVFRAISMAAAEEYLAMSSPEWISERKAKLLYGSNLKKWIDSKLVIPVEQEAKGKRVYEGHRLKALHVCFMTGKDIYECLRILQPDSTNANAPNGIPRGISKWL